jgi:DNA-binding SARP family transcriptional activator
MGLDIRLLGGFEVRGVAPAAAPFESQKVRALLAYLASRPERRFSRDHLSTVLWPESDGDSARRNLRQALYNLRQALNVNGRQVLLTDHNEAHFHLDPEDRIDVEEFQRSFRRGLPGGDEVVVQALLRAAELYRGDFLAGFYVKDSAALEEWIVSEQERHREAAIRALRMLMGYFSARGEYGSALGFARRLIEIDPLLEEGHRELMRLYVLAGRRRRAISQFEELTELLERELGVEPLPETRTLYTSILAEQMPAGDPAAAPPRPPLGPFVPLVGRASHLAALAASWQQALDGGPRLALVQGPSGIGKTRLVKSFLNRISSQRAAVVVQGRCLGPDPPIAAQPFLDVLRGLAMVRADEEPAAGGGGTEGEEEAQGAATNLVERVVERLGAFLATSERARDGRVLVLFLDDLHWCEATAWEVVDRLLSPVQGQRLWIVAACDPSSPVDPQARQRIEEHSRTDRIDLDLLGDPDLDEIATALLGETEGAERLARYLARRGGTLPLAVVEHVNSLCDDGLLVPASRQRWSLEGDPSRAPTADLDLEGVIQRRLRRLPTSARRLLSLASLIGQTFDVELLQRAGREHMGVVEICVEVMLERWLVRQYAHRWSENPRERDLVLWAQGARRGTFEFAHERIRGVAIHDINPIRRRKLQREVAAVMADRYPPESDEAAEVVWHHYLEAQEPRAALPFCAAAVAKARRLGDEATARRLARGGLAAIDRLERGGETDDELARFRRTLEEASPVAAGT